MIGIAGFIVSIYLWKYSPSTTIALKDFLPEIIIIFFFLIIMGFTFLDMAYKLFIKQKNILPSVIEGRTPYRENAEVLCILEPSEIFFHDMLVSFYYLENENFEILIGIGKVILIQENNKNIQVEMNYYSPEYTNQIEQLKSSNSEIIKKIIVKPYIPERMLELLE